MRALLGHPLIDLKPFQAAFVLQRHSILVRRNGYASEAAVRASLRRTERLLAAGLISETVLARPKPSLPVSYDGAGRRRVPARALHTLLLDDKLASHFLDLIVKRRMCCPRAPSPSSPPPSFYEHLHRL